MTSQRCVAFFCFIAITYAASAQKSFPTIPDSALIHTEDIPLFWKVYDQARPDFEGALLKKNYLEMGSAGLKGFIPMRIESGNNLSKVIRSDVSYYDNIRGTSLQIDKAKDTLYRYYRKMKELYPGSVFPELYFVIGARNSGGTTFGKGLIIGAEMFGNETSSFKPRLPFSSVNLVVIHELVHFQQNLVPDNSLLAQCIREGSADFICELVTGRHANSYFYSYGDEHEKELWDEFRSQMYEKKWDNWLYGAPKQTGRPRDLGYWMGHKISKAYYEKVIDKKQAIHDILNIKDFKSFLERSGYGQ